MPLRLSAWKPEVVSVTRWRVSSETSRANQMIPIRRASGGRYGAAPSAKREPVTMSASPRSIGAEQLRELGGIVLAVAVEPHRRLVPALERVLEPGLDGAADAEVERERSPPPRRARAATAAVPSREPSSITTTSNAGSKALISSTTPPIAASSL